MVKEFAKRFAKSGFFVFPTYKSKNIMAKPYGWTGSPVREEGKENLAIPATNNDFEIDTWDEQLRVKYKQEIAGYGILGRGCVILDVDTKNGKDGPQNFMDLATTFDFPKCSLIVKTKSGGMHLFYARPAKFKDIHIKSVANVTVSGRRYDGVDVRGDGGFVQGATSTGDWEQGVYAITRGSPETKLTELPEEFLMHVSGSMINGDLDAMTAAYTPPPKSDDISSKLRRGELPDIVPNGARNESFFIFVRALKAKGIDKESAKILCQKLAERCEDPETLHESVNIDDMLDRVFEKSLDNPFDIATDLVNVGLCQLMNYKSRPTYIILNDNPYLLSKSPHDLSSMKEMLQKYARSITDQNGRVKVVHPMDVAIKKIPDKQKADTIGFKPGAPDIFTMNDDPNGLRYLNLYAAPAIGLKPHEVDDSVYEEFKFLISRIFGPEGSTEYQLGLDFCAWFMQNPEIKCVIAPYIMSKNRGVGKSLFLNLMTRIYGVSKAGERQARIVKLNDISGRFFNPTGSLINIVDEVQFAVHRNMRQETSEFWRHLKNLVTADTIPVEIKGGGFFNLPNTAGLIMAGNSGGHFPIEEMDRRVWVIDNNPPIMQRGVVDRLYDIVLRSGTQDGSSHRNKLVDSIRWHLMQHKIKTALDSVHAPMTDRKLDMMKASMTDIEEWLYDYFNDIDNMLAATPVITRSAFVYMMQVSDQVTNEKWRDEAESIFRESKRRGTLQTIRTPTGTTAQFPNIPLVSRTGDVFMSDRKEPLYTTRDHGTLDQVNHDVIKQALFRNLNTITKWKRDSVTRAQKLVANLNE